MELQINNERLISDIQNEFRREFPYLKIEFFTTPHRKKEALPKSKMYPSTLLLGACRRNSTTGVLLIERSDSVEQVEQAFWERFGLSVQVFRQSGRVWIETNLTDSWTLERQNNYGMEISTHPNNSSPDKGQSNPKTDII